MGEFAFFRSKNESGFDKNEVEGQSFKGVKALSEFSERFLNRQWKGKNALQNHVKNGSLRC